jgi:hypothetical protein
MQVFPQLAYKKKATKIATGRDQLIAQLGHDPRLHLLDSFGVPPLSLFLICMCACARVRVRFRACVRVCGHRMEQAHLIKRAPIITRAPMSATTAKSACYPSSDVHPCRRRDHATLHPTYTHAGGGTMRHFED